MVAGTSNDSDVVADGGRLHALDHLRAAAMLLGIALHAAMSFATVPLGWVVQDVGRHWSFDVLIGGIHGFRMQLFFFIAGFFGRLLGERLGAGGFLSNRLRRIGIPFVLGMVVLVPLMGWLWVWGMGGTSEVGVGAMRIPTAHLWFLQYLMIFYGVGVVVAGLGRWVPGGLLARADGLFERWMRGGRVLILLLPVTVLVLWGGPSLGEVGEVGGGFVPVPRALVYYGMFFGMGWWVQRCRVCLGSLEVGLKKGFAMAVVALLVHWLVLAMGVKAGDPHFMVFKVVGLLGAAGYAWVMTFVATGWFSRFAARPRRWMRYLADASYWCYLIHLPLQMWMQIGVAKWPVNGWVKFAGINVVSMMILLLSYEWLVRYTWVGGVLNGRRVRGSGVTPGR